MLILQPPMGNGIAKKSLSKHQIIFGIKHPVEVTPFLANCWMKRSVCLSKQISLLEIVVVWLLLLLLLLAVDLEVETSKTPLLQMHTSSNTLVQRQGWNPIFGPFCTHRTG